jgi:hypothetical protein
LQSHHAVLPQVSPLLLGVVLMGQIHPVGSRYSANYYDVALMNWMRWYGYHYLPLSGANRSLTVGISRYGEKAFIVDQRGPGMARFQAEFPFCSRVERRQAFSQALKVWLA